MPDSKAEEGDRRDEDMIHNSVNWNLPKGIKLQLRNRYIG